MTERNANHETDKLGELDQSSLSVDKSLDKDAVKIESSQHPQNSPQGSGDSGSTEFLIGMTTWHPFIGSFLFLADCHFPKTMPAHERVQGLKAIHPFWYRVSVFLIILG